MATPQFNYTYKPLNYQDAQTQVSKQLDPLFNRAVQNVNTQKYQNDVQAGQVAASRGLAHSGLAADQLNKIAIGAQGQIGDLNANRATQVAQLANDTMNRDKEFGLQSRSQAYNEWSGQQNLANDQRDYNYQVGRDKVGDQRYTNETNYTHNRDKVGDQRYSNEWNYQVGRDKLGDQRYTNETNYTHGRDKIGDQRYTNETNYAHGRDNVTDSHYNQEYQNTLNQQKLAESWKNKEWSQMSPADKARMALE